MDTFVSRFRERKATSRGTVPLIQSSQFSSPMWPYGGGRRWQWSGLEAERARTPSLHFLVTRLGGSHSPPLPSSKLGWSEIEFLFDFWKRALCWLSGIFLWVQFEKMGKFGREGAAHLQIPSFYFKEQLPKRNLKIRFFRPPKWANIFFFF